jgi:hypothetical protein
VGGATIDFNMESQISSFPQNHGTAGRDRRGSGAFDRRWGCWDRSAKPCVTVSEIASLILLAKIKLVRFAKIAR